MKCSRVCPQSFVVFWRWQKRNAWSSSNLCPDPVHSSSPDSDLTKMSLFLVGTILLILWWLFFFPLALPLAFSIGGLALLSTRKTDPPRAYSTNTSLCDVILPSLDIQFSMLSEALVHKTQTPRPPPSSPQSELLSWSSPERRRAVTEPLEVPWHSSGTAVRLV